MLTRCCFRLALCITVAFTCAARADVSVGGSEGAVRDATYQTQSMPNVARGSDWNRQTAVTGLLRGGYQQRRCQYRTWQAAVDERSDKSPEFQGIAGGPQLSQDEILDQIAPAAEGEIIDLGTLGGEFSEAISINDTGTTVVGHSETAAGEVHAFAWNSKTRKLQDLGTLGGSFSYAQDVNDRNQIVGFSETEAGRVHGFLFADGVMQDLVTLGGNHSRATSINQSGQIVGFSQNEDHEDHAFLWKPQMETLQDLGTLGGSFSYAYSISDAGVIAGHSETEHGGVQAFTWDPESGTMQPVEALESLISFAFEVNARGQVAGYSRVEGDEYRAYVWNTSTGELTNLGLFDNEFTKAYSLGVEGKIDAYTAPAHGPNYAIRWNPTTGLLQDHSQFGGSFQVAWDMNAEGAVVGAGQTDSTQHAIMWKPIRNTTAAKSGSDIAYMVGAAGGPATDIAATYAAATGLGASKSGYTVGAGRSGGYGGGGRSNSAGQTLIVIPEPSTFVLCLIGFGLLAGSRWYRRRK